MQDRETRTDFEAKLTALIKKYNSRTDIYDKIVEDLKESITKGEISRLWSGNKVLMTLSDTDLLLFSQAFYKTIEGTKEAEEINPKNIFSDNDFNNALHVILPTSIKKDSITFHNVTRVYQKKIGYIYHIPAVSCEQLATIVNNSISNYNLEAQREGVIKEIFGEEVKVPKIFPEKINVITEKIIDGSYYPIDTIVINVLKTGSERLEFNPTTDENVGDLTLYKVEGSTNDVIDGNNRMMAAIKADSIAKEQNINIEVNFKMDIVNVPLRNSNEIIIQIDKQTPLEEDRVKALEPTKYMKISKDLNIYENEELNVLYQRLGESLKEYKDLNKISTIQIFAESLEDHYKDLLEKNNPAIYRDVLEYIISFSNEFFSNYIDNLENVEATKKQTVLFDVNMFYCYIYISKTLYELYQDNEKAWRKSVKKIARSFDFNKTNTEWGKLRTTGKLVPKAKEQLVNYLNDKLNKIIKEDEVALSV